MRRGVISSLLPLLMLVATAQAGDCGFCRTTCCPAPCQPYCAPCAPQIVERTVMVPQWQTQMQTVCCTEYRHESRPQVVTCYQSVPVVTPRTCEYTVLERQIITKQITCTVCRPVVEQVQKTYCVQVPYCETRQITRTVCRPVWREVPHTYTVMVPHCETRQGVRKVWQCVPTTQMVTTCQDCGHWEQRQCPVVCPPCGGCQPCVPTCYNVWVPNIVQKQVPVTVNRLVCVEQPCQYTVTVCHPEQRTCTRRICEFVREQVPCTVKVWACRPEYRTCTVPVCRLVPEQVVRTVCQPICVPRKVVKTVNVTTFNCVPVQKTIQVNVCVPVTVQKQVPVQVCQWVPQTIQCQVAAPCYSSCGWYGGCCR